jgi:hypothetical protein
MVLLAACTAWVTTDARGGGYMSHVWSNGPNAGSCGVDGAHCGAYAQPSAAGYVGPYGAPVPMAYPPMVAPVSEAEALARMTLAQSLPPDLLRQISYNAGGPMGPQILLASGTGGQPPSGPPGAVAAVGALTGGPGAFPIQRTSVRFVGPSDMKISWYAPRANGQPGFGAEYLTAPGRYNFSQGAIYRLKLSDIPNRPAAFQLYPTLEVVPANAKTCTFLAHSSVPVSFTEEDFDQVAAGNFVVKVIYLPDPQFQDLATTGPDEVVSSRLEPRVDPIAEAHRPGSILLIVRLGNIDLEAPNTPAMDAPSPYQNCPAPGMARMPGMPPGMANVGQMPGMQPMGPMPPYNTANGGRPQMMQPPTWQPGMMPTPVQPIPPAVGPTPGVPTGNPPAPAASPAPGVPLSKLPAGSAVQQVQYKAPTGPTPTVAELAGQSGR